jgi:hypothetical protein
VAKEDDTPPPRRVEALAKFEFDRIERESDLRVADGPMGWVDAEPGLRKEMLEWATSAIDAIGAAEPLDTEDAKMLLAFINRDVAFGALQELGTLGKLRELAGVVAS